MTREAVCPECGADHNSLHVYVSTAYPIVCIQGQGFSYDKEASTAPCEILDEDSEVGCTNCGYQGQWWEFLKKRGEIRDAYENGKCPDCQEEIPDDALDHSECKNCGHVFCKERECDDNTYKNFYRCPDDGTEWEMFWSAMCNDRCPKCNKEIEPYKSEDAASTRR